MKSLVPEATPGEGFGTRVWPFARVIPSNQPRNGGSPQTDGLATPGYRETQC